jgi:hypothetical protein
MRLIGRQLFPHYFDQGMFLDNLRRRVAIPSSSQEPQRAAALRAHLVNEIVPLNTLPPSPLIRLRYDKYFVLDTWVIRHWHVSTNAN